MISVKLAVLIRNFAIGGIIFGALSSLVAGIFVEKEVALNILLWPLLVSMPFIILPPLMAKACPSCNKSFFGNWFSIDIHTSRCKHCGHSL
jgi:hypothetical protein